MKKDLSILDEVNVGTTTGPYQLHCETSLSELYPSGRRTAYHQVRLGKVPRLNPEDPNSLMEHFMLLRKDPLITETNPVEKDFADGDVLSLHNNFLQWVENEKETLIESHNLGKALKREL